MGVAVLGMEYSATAHGELRTGSRVSVNRIYRTTGSCVSQLGGCKSFDGNKTSGIKKLIPLVTSCRRLVGGFWLPA
jgi:hypothetical protein